MRMTSGARKASEIAARTAIFIRPRSDTKLNAVSLPDVIPSRLAWNSRSWSSVSRFVSSYSSSSNSCTRVM